MWTLTTVYLQAGTKCTHREAPACLGCRFSTLSAHLKVEGGQSTHVWLLIEQLSKTNSRRRLNLNMAFWTENHKRRKTLEFPTLVTTSNPLSAFIQPFFFLPFSFCSPLRHHFSLITFQIWPRSNKNSILTQVLQLMSLRTLKNKECLSGPQFPHLIRRAHFTRRLLIFHAELRTLRL